MPSASVVAWNSSAPPRMRMMAPSMGWEVTSLTTVPWRVASFSSLLESQPVKATAARSRVSVARDRARMEGALGDSEKGVPERDHGHRRQRPRQSRDRLKDRPQRAQAFRSGPNDIESTPLPNGPLNRNAARGPPLFRERRERAARPAVLTTPAFQHACFNTNPESPCPRSSSRSTAPTATPTSSRRPSPRAPRRRAPRSGCSASPNSRAPKRP